MRELATRSQPGRDHATQHDQQDEPSEGSFPAAERRRPVGPYPVDVARVLGCWVVSVPCLPEIVEYVERLDQAEPCARRSIAAALGVPAEQVTIDLRLSANPPGGAAGHAAPQLSQDALDPSPY